MGERHVHFHLPARDIGKSTPELLKIVKDPGADEGAVGVALKILASRGINPKNGQFIGVAAAMKIVREMGDMAGS